MDFAADTYYRHYRLYLYLFTSKKLLDISVAAPAAEVASHISPLSEGAPQDSYEGEDVPVEPEEPEEVPPTEEEAAQQLKEEDENLLADPKSEMIQELVAKRLECVKEELDAELKAKETEYQERIAAATAGEAE